MKKGEGENAPPTGKLSNIYPTRELKALGLDSSDPNDLDPSKKAAFIKGLKIALRVTVPLLSSLAVFPEEGDKEVESEHEREKISFRKAVIPCLGSFSKKEKK